MNSLFWDTVTAGQARALDPRVVGDVDRAEFFCLAVSGELVYVEGPGWHSWSGTHWVKDDSRDQSAARGKVHEISNVLLERAVNGDTAYVEAARAFRSSGRIDNILKEAKSSSLGLRRKVSDLDKNPYLLNFRNGTVDLRTGTCREHDPEDLITHLIDYDYREDADRSRWVEYLAASQPDDPDMIDFLQRLAGYGLSASTAEEKLAFFYGSGRNGKGVYTETLQKIFHPVTTTQNGDFWEKQRYGVNGALVAKLHGARMVFSSEMTAARLDEAFVKGYVAADSLTANPKHKTPYDFTPCGLLVLSGNDKPTIRGTDEGIWARFLCVPWDESFVGREDKTLKRDLLDPKHAEGVISWCVEGAARYFSEGDLAVPARVSDATNEYREEQNPYADWLEEKFTADPDGFVSNAEVKQAARDWHPKLPGSDRAIKAVVVKHFGVNGNAQKKISGRVVKGLAGVSLVSGQGGMDPFL